MDKNVILFGAGLGLVLVVAAALIARRFAPDVAAAAGAVVDAVNPVNPGNVFNRTFEDVAGGSVWDLLHPDQARDNHIMPLPVIRNEGGATGGW